MQGVQNEREWGAFCRVVLQAPDVATDERFLANSKRTAHREELRSLIVEVFSSLTLEQVRQRLDDAQIANASVNSMHDVWDHPQLKARGRWTNMSTPHGDLAALLPPGLSNAYSPRMDKIPALGEHTEGLLRELGLSDKEIESMHLNGAI